MRVGAAEAIVPFLKYVHRLGVYSLALGLSFASIESATFRRWILPVAVLGISFRIHTCVVVSAFMIRTISYDSSRPHPLWHLELGSLARHIVHDVLLRNALA